MKISTPRVLIIPDAKQELERLMKTGRTEAGIGKVTQQGQDFQDFVVTEILHLASEDPTSSKMILNEGALGLLKEYIERGNSDIKLCWCSRGIFGLGWSLVNHSDWTLSITGNGKEEYGVRLDIYKPQRLTFNNLTLQVSET